MAARASTGAFVTARPQLLHVHPGSEAAAGRGWPSPRSWDMAARLLAAAEVAAAGAEITALLVAGAIGPGAAAEFLAWREDMDLPDPEAALLDPGSFKVPDRGDRAYAALAALSAAVLANNTPARWEAAWRAVSSTTSQRHADIAVDERGRLLIDPAKLAEWPVPQVAGVLLHEVGHVLRDHASRARTIGATGALERRVWNVAGDADINDDLPEAGVELPASPVTPQALELPAHRAAEFYYAALTERGYLPADELDCGPGSDGTPWGGPERPLPPGLPQLLPPGLAPHEVVLLRQKVAAEIARRGSVSPGSVPGGWQRWAQATLHPQLDWRRLLTARVRSCTAAVSGATDYSYSRQPRRRVPGVVLPAMRRPLPRVAVIADTSGSVSADLLSLAWTEVHGCLRHLSVRRDLLAAPPRTWSSSSPTASRPGRRPALAAMWSWHSCHCLSTA
jgi:hypothetical protein